MADQWQTIAVLGIVLMAVVYLVRRAWRTIAKRRAAGCGACGSCPAGGENPAGKTLVQLETFAKSRTKAM